MFKDFFGLMVMVSFATAASIRSGLNVDAISINNPVFISEDDDKVIVNPVDRVISLDVYTADDDDKVILDDDYKVTAEWTEFTARKDSIKLIEAIMNKTVTKQDIDLVELIEYIMTSRQAKDIDLIKLIEEIMNKPDTSSTENSSTLF